MANLSLCFCLAGQDEAREKAAVPPSTCRPETSSPSLRFFSTPSLSSDRSLSQPAASCAPRASSAPRCALRPSTAVLRFCASERAAESLASSAWLYCALRSLDLSALWVGRPGKGVGLSSQHRLKKQQPLTSRFAWMRLAFLGSAAASASAVKLPLPPPLL